MRPAIYAHDPSPNIWRKHVRKRLAHDAIAVVLIAFVELSSVRAVFRGTSLLYFRLRIGRAFGSCGGWHVLRHLWRQQSSSCRLDLPPPPTDICNIRKPTINKSALVRVLNLRLASAIPILVWSNWSYSYSNQSNPEPSSDECTRHFRWRQKCVCTVPECSHSSRPIVEPSALLHTSRHTPYWIRVYEESEEEWRLWQWSRVDSVFEYENSKLSIRHQ